MPVLCLTNRRGPSVNDVVPLLFAVCIFLTFLSHVELLPQPGVLKVGGEDESPINGITKAARIEENVTVQESPRLGEVCSPRDIALSQSMKSTLPNGITEFFVEIVNECATECTISNIHVKCGSFASTVPVNPSTFRLLAYDDCLVNNGENLAEGDSVTFVYANSFMYPLSVASVDCPGN